MSPVVTMAGVTAGPSLVVVKRDGSVQPFDLRRIERALALACADLMQWTIPSPKTLAAEVYERVQATPGGVLDVEQIQDIVVAVLTDHGEHTHATHYRRYRQAHAKLRAERPIPPETRAAFEDSARTFTTPLQLFQYYSKYARYDYGLGRRESWPETVARTIAFLYQMMREQGRSSGTLIDWADLQRAILNLEVLPSMRLLAMAGPAAARNNLCLYNCSYMPVADTRAFAEALLISMCGCGVGYSVERQYVEQFPRVQRRGTASTTLVVEDTTESWVETLHEALNLWFTGVNVRFDYSQIRPAGTPLRVKGGQASGPEPLRRMHQALDRILQARQGTFLRPIDVHDMMCWVGQAAVSGGVRRTAMLALFDWDDQEMRLCKDGDLSLNPQRYNANNSVVWPGLEDLTQLDVMRQFVEMDAGQRGEPGIFNRDALTRAVPERRKALGSYTYGTNPCGEIILRPYGLCNLSAAVIRPDDHAHDALRKVGLATQLGTLQSLATHFPGLRAEWGRNAIEERLLGVDLPGQMDAPTQFGAYDLAARREYAIETNTVLARQLGINPAAAVTCVKPSGNSSVLLNSSSGIHPRYGQFYLRRVRMGAHEPLTQVLRDAGVPLLPEVGQTAANASTFVAEFPVASPTGALTRGHISAIAQLEWWLTNKRHWTEHNPSCTVQYSPDELLDIAHWVWKHRLSVGGLTFLPRDDAAYTLAPYEAITAQDYHERAQALPRIDLSKLVYYETTDTTTASVEAACTTGQCEL